MLHALHRPFHGILDVAITKYLFVALAFGDHLVKVLPVLKVQHTVARQALLPGQQLA